MMNLHVYFMQEYFSSGLWGYVYFMQEYFSFGLWGLHELCQDSKGEPNSLHNTSPKIHKQFRRGMKMNRAPLPQKNAE